MYMHKERVEEGERERESKVCHMCLHIMFFQWDAHKSMSNGLEFCHCYNMQINLVVTEMWFLLWLQHID